MSLVEHVEHYVTFRKALGHAYGEQERSLRDYAAYAEACGDRFVRNSTVLDWVSKTPSPQRAQIKLRRVCDLASVLYADDERHEAPDPICPGEGNIPATITSSAVIDRDQADHGCSTGVATGRLDHTPDIPYHTVTDRRDRFATLVLNLSITRPT